MVKMFVVSHTTKMRTLWGSCPSVCYFEDQSSIYTPGKLKNSNRRYSSGYRVASLDVTIKNYLPNCNRNAKWT